MLRPGASALRAEAFDDTGALKDGKAAQMVGAVCSALQRQVLGQHALRSPQQP